MRKMRHSIGLLVASLSLGAGGSVLMTTPADAGTITVGPISVTLPGGTTTTTTTPAPTPVPETTTGFNFSQAAYNVDENAGDAVITVVRGGNLLPAAQVRYHTPPLAVQTALANVNYTPVNGTLDFAAGQASASFAVPIKDLGVAGLPSQDFYVALYGASVTPLGTTTQATVTIDDTDTGALSKILGDPLGLLSSSSSSTTSTPTATTASVSSPLASNPLAGVRFFVDKQWGIAARYARYHPQYASKLNVIADEPIAMRFVASNTGGDPALAVSRFLIRAEASDSGAVPEISTYELNHHGTCITNKAKQPGHGHYTDSPAQLANYEAWVRSLANGISSRRAVVYLEIDGLITTPCLSPLGLHRRVLELRYAAQQLAALPRTAVYVDAGAGDALSARQAASLLNQVGVANIQGFFLNATHYDWTSKELKYGYAISRLTHNAHFVVNTAVNGRGPLVPHSKVANGNEVRCNPAGRGLGPKPTTNTGYKDVDAFAWIGNPGLSTGTCGNPRVNPPTGVFDLSYALSLVKYADFRIR